MHVTYLAINRGHTNTALCTRGTALRRRREAATTIQRARAVNIQVLGNDLERVTTFKYLGRVLAANNSDWPALFANINKARGKWALISRPLLRTGVSTRVIGMFYKAIVQSVLLYGSETWVVTPQMLKMLDGFHHRIARRITNKMPTRLGNDTWHYPPIQEALDDAGLYTITEYIQRRQNTIAQYIANRPIHQLCVATNASNTSRAIRWWNQPLRTQQPPTPNNNDTSTSDSDDTNFP